MDPLEWQLPGGRVAFGESPIEALGREVAEGTGLAVEVVAPVATWHYVKGRFQLVGIDFLCDPTSARAERPGYSTGEDSQTPASGNQARQYLVPGKGGRPDASLNTVGPIDQHPG
jgi:hypothetical protein